MNTYLLTVSTPDGNFLDEQVAGLYLRGSEGDLAILANHVPFVTAVKAGDCKIELANGDIKLAHTDGGLLMVTSNGVKLLSATFAWLEG